MAKEKRPAKKVVKKVVRKPVTAKPPEAEPAMRFGRPTARTRSYTRAKPYAPEKNAKQAKPPRPSREWGRKTTHTLSRAGSQINHSARMAGVGTRDRALGTRDRAWDAFDAIRDYRLPRFAQPVASAITGIIVGLITVGISTGFAELFTEVRGTSTGGGLWGSLSLAVVAIADFAAGAFLLARLHVRQPRITSLVALCMALIVILAFLIDVVGSSWALLVVPLLGAGCYAAAHQLILIAETGHEGTE